MRYLIGSVLIALGFFHGLHAWSIDTGSVIDLNGSRFLSFAALDRLASSGSLGKLVVLLIDGLMVALGLLEVTGRSRFLFRSKEKKPPPTPVKKS